MIADHTVGFGDVEPPEVHSIGPQHHVVPPEVHSIGPLGPAGMNALRPLPLVPSYKTDHTVSPSVCLCLCACVSVCLSVCLCLCVSVSLSLSQLKRTATEEVRLRSWCALAVWLNRLC